MKPDNEKDETQQEEELAGGEGAADNKLTEPDEELLEDGAGDEIGGEPGEDAREESVDKAAPATDDDAADDDETDDEDVEAAVVYENGRPLVQELEYQAPRGKAAAGVADDGESVEVKFTSVSEAKSVIEGFLFSCNEPLSVNKLSKLMSNLHPKTVRGLLLELQWEYENRPGGLQVVEIAGGYQMSTRAFVAPWMFRMHKHKRRSALSPATLETLAIVAYRQPITKGEIEAIRGVESGAPLRTLQELNLVEASGRREVIGRPQLYVTTEVFLKTFGLKSVGDLPSISELKARFTEEQKLKPVVAATPTKAADEAAGEEGEAKDEELVNIEETEENVALEGGADESDEENLEDSDDGNSDADDADEFEDVSSEDDTNVDTNDAEDLDEDPEDIDEEVFDDDEDDFDDDEEDLDEIS